MKRNPRATTREVPPLIHQTLLMHRASISLRAFFHSRIDGVEASGRGFHREHPRRRPVTWRTQPKVGLFPTALRGFDECACQQGLRIKDRIGSAAHEPAALTASGACLLAGTFFPAPLSDNGTRTHTDHSPMARGTKSAPVKTALSICSASPGNVHRPATRNCFSHEMTSPRRHDATSSCCIAAPIAPRQRGIAKQATCATL